MLASHLSWSWPYPSGWSFTHQQLAMNSWYHLSLHRVEGLIPRHTEQGGGSRGKKCVHMCLSLLSNCILELIGDCSLQWFIMYFIKNHKRGIWSFLAYTKNENCLRRWKHWLPWLDQYSIITLYYISKYNFKIIKTLKCKIQILTKFKAKVVFSKTDNAGMANQILTNENLYKDIL
jgi:hypothetical protein